MTGRGRIWADVIFSGSSDNGGAKCWGRWVTARLAGGTGRHVGKHRVHVFVCNVV